MVPRLIFLDVVASGQLIDRLIFDNGWMYGDEIMPGRTPADDDLLEAPTEVFDTLELAPALEPLFLTLVRTMKRQIFGLPRTRR
mmetsp:Transcript_12918/g.32581  ORF Transcript_12918/g.32581 Transcript_12918/m.32581 type:complete len:84 (+) Transcript_12918:1039-1290(+)